MEKIDYRRMPNLLRKYRRIRGLSQRQAAKILGLKSASRISRWESGGCVPSLVNAVRLSILYRTMTDALFSDLRDELREEIKHGEQRLFGRESSEP